MKVILKILNACINMVVIFAMLLAGSYAAFALWDNNRVYSEAENIQENLLKLKPTIGNDNTEGQNASFDDLLAINPDVCAWLTLDNTDIDYPVVQGENNLTYINKNVYKDFALAGSIYLDSRNNRDFSDNYCLLYGHHMDNNLMFGDLDMYKDKSFFNENKTGTLILPDKSYKLVIIACLTVPASQEEVFDPTVWQDDIEQLIPYIQHNARNIDNTSVYNIHTENGRILAMSTCASDYTDARTVLITLMKPC